MTRLRIHAGLADVPGTAWDDLLGDDQPFMRHAFLLALEETGCLRPDWGWEPLHATLWEGGQLLAAAPGYRKTNSHGEFVFDHAWAHAWARHGLEYYPKWLVAVPYSPVPGPRVLCRDGAHGRALLEEMSGHALEAGLSSVHVNFLRQDMLDRVPEDWLARSDVQFHWHRDPRWRDVADFLDALERKRRKNIRAERRQVQAAGFDFERVDGSQIADDDLAHLHALYCLAFARKGNSPALTLEFLRRLCRDMPRNVLFVLARQHGRLLAGAICLRDGQRLYGRYWGSEVEVPGLHFETCYYQGIEHCLAEGIDSFEPGAQGEHKVARGFLPVITHSRHHVADARFADALQHWCRDEREHAQRYAAMIERDHNPYREAPALAGP